MLNSTLKSGYQVETELRPSPKLVAALLVMAALVINVTGDMWLVTGVVPGVLVFGLLLYGVAGAIWALDSWQTQVARWMAVIGVAVIVSLGLTWLQVPGFVAFFTLPVALAAALLNFPAALIVTIGQTALLALLTQTGFIEVELMSVLAILVALWLILGLMYVVYRPMSQIILWSWEQYQHTQDLLEEARQRKLELEQALDALAHANREMSLLNERVAAMRLAAEEAQKAKTVFVAKVSHEFRTPLNMIIGLTDLLIEKPEVVYGRKLPPALLEDLKIVHRNCEHLSSMVNDVLDLSQTEIGRLTLHREWVDLSAEINAATLVVQPLLEKKNLSLQILIPATLPPVYCDKTRIRQVILNLVSNAARFTETGGITVRAAPEGRHVAVNVTDTGPGIAPADAAKIFDPFFQAGGDMWHNREGSGLGLSISKQFVERHEGQIWVESEVGVGSTFSFKIPISPVPPVSGGAGRWVNEDWVFLERPTWPTLPKLPYKQRVVLCDETSDLYPLFHAYYDQIEFVDTKNLAQTAQELLRCPAHAVIVNTASPAALEPLLERARQEITDTPLVGCSLSFQRAHVSEAGTVDYLIKPVTQTALEKALRGVKTPVKHLLIVDDDPDVRQLFSRMALANDPALDIVTVADGLEALRELRARPYDLVLLDILMPEMDGWQVLRLKEQDEAIKHIPVIIVSAEDVITKPIVSEVLLATMGQGLSIQQVLRCSLELSKLLLGPVTEPALAPQ